MITYAEKTQENKTQTVASRVSQKQGEGRPFQFVDNRPEAIAQRKLQKIAINSLQAQKAIQLKRIINSAPLDNSLSVSIGAVVQRAVPGDGTPFKPVANTGSYRARGGQDTRFDSDAHTRARFGFGTNTRYEVFSRYNLTMQGNRIVSIRASNGEQVNVEGIQLDHQVSWDNISTEMDRKNNEGTDQFYSFWDAKMYYNDIGNLAPAIGALNAAAGAGGVAVEPRQSPTIEAAVGAVQHSWMNLQQVMVALNSGQGNTQISDEEMTNILLDINASLSGLVERLLE